VAGDRGLIVRGVLGKHFQLLLIVESKNTEEEMEGSSGFTPDGKQEGNRSEEERTWVHVRIKLTPNHKQPTKKGTCILFTRGGGVNEPFDTRMSQSTLYAKEKKQKTSVSGRKKESKEGLS